MEEKSNGWAEHKIHINAEISTLRRDVDKIADALNQHLIDEAKFWAEVKSEIKYHSKVIIAATSILSVILSAILFTLIPRIL